MNHWISSTISYFLQSPSRAYLFVFVTSLLLFSLNIQGLSIYALDEAKNAECAREMYEQGELVVPTFNYQLRGDKPPLHYYFMMLGFQLFGVNEFGARFFGAFSGALLLLFTFRYTWKYLGKGTAWLSMGILWASLHLSLQFHMAVPDPYLITTMGLSILFFYEFLSERKVWALLCCYLTIGLGVLTKGPIAVALPGLIMLLHLLSTRQLHKKTLLSLKPWWGVLIVLGISLPWFILVHQATDGAWTEEFFFKHNLRRFSEPLEGHGGIFLITFAFIIGGMLPFSLFFPQAGIFAWKKRRESSFIDLCFWAVASIITFFAISSTKLPNYTVPAYPFVAILLANYLIKRNEYSLADKISYGLYMLIALALPVAAYMGIKADSIVADLYPLAWGLILVPIGALLGGYFIWRGQPIHMFKTVTASWILTSAVFYFFLFPPIDDRNPVSQTLPLLENQPSIIQYQLINRAFNFYLKRPIPVLEEEEEIMPHFEQHPKDVLIVRKAYWEKLDSVPKMKIIAETPDLFEKHTTLILTLDKSANKP